MADGAKRTDDWRMYDFQETVETSAKLEDVWAVYADVNGWLRWMPHLRALTWSGPFESGSTGVATVAVGVDAEVKFHLENVSRESDRASFDVVWTVGPLLHTRMTHTMERTPTGTRFTHAYHTGGIMAPFNFLQAAAARDRVGPAMAAIAKLAGGH